jgi:hypothetical protein
LLDRLRRDPRFGERGAQGRPLARPHFAQERRGGFPARFEIPARPPRALRAGRSSPRRCRVRWPGGVPAARLLEPLRSSSPGDRPVPGIGVPPAGGRPDDPALPRGRGSYSRRKAMRHDGERTGEGDDRGEPGRGASLVLGSLPPGGEATGGESPASGAGAEEDGGHRDSAPGATSRGACDRPTGWTRSDPPRPGDVSDRSGADGGRADDRDRDPDPHHGQPGVPGLAEDGEGGAVARPARGDGRAGPHGGAGTSDRGAAEEEGLGPREGEARGADRGRSSGPAGEGRRGRPTATRTWTSSPGGRRWPRSRWGSTVRAHHPCFDGSRASYPS